MNPALYGGTIRGDWLISHEALDWSRVGMSWRDEPWNRQNMCSWSWTANKALSGYGWWYGWP